MIGWGDILSADQIRDLVKFIRELGAGTPEEAAPPTFVNDVLPIFKTQCNMYHGKSGDWDGSSYDSVMNSGEHGPQ